MITYFKKNIIGTNREHESIRDNMLLLVERNLFSSAVKNFLDVGCGGGENTIFIAHKLNIPLADVYGLDIDSPCVKITGHLFQFLTIDLEKEALPFHDNMFDLVICNQVFEHLKNFLQIFNEIIRVTNPAGYIMIGIPNLAHLINRYLLLFGRQPMCIGILSSHVRGFTHKTFHDFICSISTVKLLDQQGSSLIYPLPHILAKPLSKVFTGLCAYTCYLLQKNPTND
ncbi:MAG: class I SAM-dependent methyltransferase [Syntrophales bacterium]|jgi:SAM-dependent methyltransferase